MFYFIISYQKGKRLYCERNLTLLEDTWTANITQYIEILKAQNFIDILIYVLLGMLNVLNVVGTLYCMYKYIGKE